MESDQMSSVLFLGGESSGKTTLSKKFAQLFGYHYIEEFGRTWYDVKNGVLTVDDLFHIADVQTKLEDSARSAGHSITVDTNILVTEFYINEMFGQSLFPNGDIAVLVDRMSQYDSVVLCENDFDFVQDGTRQGIEFSRKQRDFYVSSLEQLGIRYTTASGSLANRLTTITVSMGSAL
jgi:HTH-type transcriptional regulator, transcriptional repressor of NAD biosynthesis genes